MARSDLTSPAVHRLRPGLILQEQTGQLERRGGRAMGWSLPGPGQILPPIFQLGADKTLEGHDPSLATVPSHTAPCHPPQNPQFIDEAKSFIQDE